MLIEFNKTSYLISLSYFSIAVTKTCYMSYACSLAYFNMHVVCILK